jgi:peptidoglycan/LPS O-acetylase OafA/YrhL
MRLSREVALLMRRYGNLGVALFFVLSGYLI